MAWVDPAPHAIGIVAVLAIPTISSKSTRSAYDLALCLAGGDALLERSGDLRARCSSLEDAGICRPDCGDVFMAVIDALANPALQHDEVFILRICNATTESPTAVPGALTVLLVRVLHVESPSPTLLSVRRHKAAMLRLGCIPRTYRGRRSMVLRDILPTLIAPTQSPADHKPNRNWKDAGCAVMSTILPGQGGLFRDSIDPTDSTQRVMLSCQPNLQSRTIVTGYNSRIECLLLSASHALKVSLIDEYPRRPDACRCGLSSQSPRSDEVRPQKLYLEPFPLGAAL